MAGLNMITFDYGNDDTEASPQIGQTGNNFNPISNIGKLPL